MVYNAPNYAKKLQLLLVLLLPTITLFFVTLKESSAAEKPGVRDELDLRQEIAYVHFQIARANDALGNIKKDGAFGDRSPEANVSPGDELEIAGDLKFSAFQEYQTAMKQWEKIAKSVRRGEKVDRAKAAMDNADIAWEACKRALNEAVEIHRQAGEYFETSNNLERKTAVLGKLARNLERLLDLKR